MMRSTRGRCGEGVLVRPASCMRLPKKGFKEIPPSEGGKKKKKVGGLGQRPFGLGFRLDAARAPTLPIPLITSIEEKSRRREKGYAEGILEIGFRGQEWSTLCDKRTKIRSTYS